LKVHGAWVSLSGRKKVEDAHGKHLFDIVKELLHIHTTYAIEDTHGKKTCEVKSSLKCKHHTLRFKATQQSRLRMHCFSNY
jgi:uncharacterized protein YxjI